MKVGHKHEIPIANTKVICQVCKHFRDTRFWSRHRQVTRTTDMFLVQVVTCRRQWSKGIRGKGVHLKGQFIWHSDGNVDDENGWFEVSSVSCSEKFTRESVSNRWCFLASRGGWWRPLGYMWCCMFSSVNYQEQSVVNIFLHVETFSAEGLLHVWSFSVEVCLLCVCLSKFQLNQECWFHSETCSLSVFGVFITVKWVS